MPPKQKRALQEADPNAETQASSTSQGSKKQKQSQNQKENQPPTKNNAAGKKGAKDKNASKHNHDDEDEEALMDKLPSYEYILMDRPMYDFRNEAEARANGHADDDKSEVSELDEDEDEQHERLLAEFKKAQKANKHGELASTKPDHNWVCVRGTWIRFCDTVRLASYRSPDAFGMYIYNDFEGYGMHEMVENFMVDFNKEFSKKQADQSLNEMWSTLSALIHWMNHDRRADLFSHIDDGERVAECWEMVGSAFLSMLNLLDRSEQLGPDSNFKDLALIVALFLNLRGFWVNFDCTFQLDVLRHAKDHKIDLAQSGVSGLKAYLDEQEQELTNHQQPPKAALDRWDFKKAFKAHTQSYGKGGDEYDVTKMSRAERKSHAFDKKDPLAAFSDKDIKSGGLMLA